MMIGFYRIWLNPRLMCSFFAPMSQVRTIVKPGCSQDVLKAALSAMASLTAILSLMSSPSNTGV